MVGGWKSNKYAEPDTTWIARLQSHEIISVPRGKRKSCCKCCPFPFFCDSISWQTVARDRRPENDHHIQIQMGIKDRNLVIKHCRKHSSLLGRDKFLILKWAKWIFTGNDFPCYKVAYEGNNGMMAISTAPSKAESICNR